MKHQFRSRKDVTKYLAEKGIDTSNWSEEKWQSLNKGQAEIHMMVLAEAMWDAYNESIPKQLKAGEWHIPFSDNIDTQKLKNAMLHDHSIEDSDDPTEDEINKYKIAVATARCARVSYTVVGEEGKPDNYENDIKLHDRLAASGHASPFEHIAQCMSYEEYEESTLYNIDNTETKGVSRNFRGFKQYRELMKL